QSLLVERIPVIFGVAIALGKLSFAQAESGCMDNLGPLPGPDVVVKESEPFVRIRVHRGETNVVETMDYFTVDGPAHFPTHAAQAGVDYLGGSGTITFPIGQYIASLDIPLIDNGLVDGFKDFTLVFTNSLGVYSATSIRIEDNEMR